MRIMWCFLCLYNQPEFLNFASVFAARSHDINSGGIDAAVTQNIRQLCNVLFQSIECPGKELAQIVWKDLGMLHTGFLTELFHLRPNVAPIDRLTISCDENGSL